jgi:urease accessory protein
VRRTVLLLTFAALLVGASSAQAHLMNSGFGPFYDGLAHPLTSPPDLLPLLAAALLAGLRGPQSGRWMLAELPLAWLGGMVLGARFAIPVSAAWLTCAFTILLGALVAADRALPLWALAGLVGLFGGAQGLMNGQELARADSAPLVMAGIVCALFMVVSLLAGQAAMLRAGWKRIVVRVAGSWIAAVGLLMLGWAVRAATR